MQWLETRPNRQVCPVCKAGISRDKVIPLYGRGSTGQQDPRWVLCCIVGHTDSKLNILCNHNPPYDPPVVNILYLPFVM